MKTRRLISFFCISLLAAASVGADVANGEPAPDFTLRTATGEEVSLSDFKGDYVILEWVNTGCPFVQKFYNAGAMQRFQEEARNMGEETEVVWLSINSTNPEHSNYMTPEETAAYIEEKQVNSTWLLDPTGKVGKAYGATNTPHMFLITPEGTVVYQGAIDSIRSTDPDDIEKADNYILAALSNAIKGEPIDPDRTRPYGCTMKY